MMETIREILRRNWKAIGYFMTLYPFWGASNIPFCVQIASDEAVVWSKRIKSSYLIWSKYLRRPSTYSSDGGYKMPVVDSWILSLLQSHLLNNPREESLTLTQAAHLCVFCSPLPLFLFLVITHARSEALGLSRVWLVSRSHYTHLAQIITFLSDLPVLLSITWAVTRSPRQPSFFSILHMLSTGSDRAYSLPGHRFILLLFGRQWRQIWTRCLLHHIAVAALPGPGSQWHHRLHHSFRPLQCFQAHWQGISQYLQRRGPMSHLGTTREWG